jgi:hypothetical protein
VAGRKCEVESSVVGVIPGGNALKDSDCSIIDNDGLKFAQMIVSNLSRSEIFEGWY